MGKDSHSHSHGNIFESENLKVPDWRIYKIEDAPELVAVQKALQVHGLKNNWLRNEVWRHTNGDGHTVKARVKFIFKGFKYGLIAAVITTGLEMALLPSHHEGDHHGGDHH